MSKLKLTKHAWKCLAAYAIGITLLVYLFPHAISGARNLLDTVSDAGENDALALDSRPAGIDPR